MILIFLCILCFSKLKWNNFVYFGFIWRRHWKESTFMVKPLKDCHTSMWPTTIILYLENLWFFRVYVLSTKIIFRVFSWVFCADKTLRGKAKESQAVKFLARLCFVSWDCYTSYHTCIFEVRELFLSFCLFLSYSYSVLLLTNSSGWLWEQLASKSDSVLKYHSNISYTSLSIDHHLPSIFAGNILVKHR